MKKNSLKFLQYQKVYYICNEQSNKRKMKVIALSKKPNKFNKYDKVVDIIECDGEFINYEALEYHYLNNNQGCKIKGWKKCKRSMLIEDFHSYFNVLDYDFNA